MVQAAGTASTTGAAGASGAAGSKNGSIGATTTTETMVTVTNKWTKETKEFKIPTSIYKVRANGLILAPTNRVANRMSRKCNMDAETNQFFLKFALHNDIRDRWGELEFLPLEELSLVGEKTFNDIIYLTRYLPSLIRVVFNGDHKQLPSVQPGNVINSLRKSRMIERQDLEVNQRVDEMAAELRECVRWLNEGDFKRILRHSDQFQVRKFDLTTTYRQIYERHQHEDLADFHILCHTVQRAREANIYFLLCAGHIFQRDLPIPSHRPILPYLFVGEKVGCTDNLVLGEHSFDRNQILVIARIYDVVGSPYTQHDARRSDQPFVFDYSRGIRSDERYIELKDLLTKQEYKVKFSATMLQTFVPAYASTVHVFQGEETDHGECILEEYSTHLIAATAASRSRKSCRLHMVCRPYFDEWDSLAQVIQRKEPPRISALEHLIVGAARPL